ncbi:130aa long hypothetical protein [Pyrococcus horikoshii OT3]|uniref:Uncharacterized protein n=1 Tax=Pyrococcus horikoshii (strain ATCC 700860 / DSM 12428 / JCM 9974 / NBRC 100139 / OT-3) TaxID=70601 RepID=O59211_PYRHO|nr:130aa long hypothetical protein [Pyrococcus horikoshii OT3]
MGIPSVLLISLGVFPLLSISFITSKVLVEYFLGLPLPFSTGMILIPICSRALITFLDTLGYKLGGQPITLTFGEFSRILTIISFVGLKLMYTSVTSSFSTSSILFKSSLTFLPFISTLITLTLEEAQGTS